MKKSVSILTLVFITFLNVTFGNPTATDSLVNSIQKLYRIANKTYQEKNLPLALDLYAQFIQIANTKNFNENLWKEMRISYSYMASINMSLSDYNNAATNFKKALEYTLKHEPDQPKNSLLFLFNIAKSYYNQYDYNNSLLYYQEAEAILNTSGDSSRADYSFVYNNMALCHLKLGNIPESQLYITKSINIKKELNDIAALAKSYNNFGLIFQSMGEFKSAITYLNSSLSIYDSLKNWDRSAFVTNNIGNLYLETKTLDTCKFYYLKSLRIKKKEKVDNRLDLIKSYNNLSYIYMLLKKNDSAHLYNQEAINLNRIKTNLEDSLEYYSISDYLTSISDRIELNHSNYLVTSDKKQLEESYNFLNPTVKILVEQVLKFNSMISSNIFINENRRFFDLLMITAHELDILEATSCPRSIIISETYKSLSLFNLASELKNLQFKKATPHDLERLSKYYQWQQELVDFEPGINIATVALIDSIISYTLEAELIKQNYKLNLKNNILNYFSTLGDSITSRCNKLGDELILDYYITKDLIIIQSLTKTGITYFSTDATPAFTNAIASLPFSIQSLNQPDVVEQAKQLSAILINPNAPTIEQFENISIIPDEVLTGIPFECLYIKDPDSQRDKYLIELKLISYRFSILNRNYSRINENKGYSTDFLGISPNEPNGTTYHNLNSSAREIQEITELFRKSKLEACSLLGSEATYDNFANSAFDSKILHFSTHSNINIGNSNLSSLELFSYKESSTLFLPVLSGIPFQNDLLLLNACETASNLINPSSGFVSFTRSISNILINNYICSLWKIYDDLSYNFILSFYHDLLQEKTYKTALTNVKRQYINSENYNYPLFWSPFILYENN